jgi:hypothetical protein
MRGEDLVKLVGRGIRNMKDAHSYSNLVVIGEVLEITKLHFTVCRERDSSKARLAKFESERRHSKAMIDELKHQLDDEKTARRGLQDENNGLMGLLRNLRQNQGDGGDDRYLNADHLPFYSS